MVQWDEVPADNQNGIVVNYTVTYAELPAGDSGKEIVIAPRTNQWYIDRIEKIYQLQHHSVCIYSQGGGRGGGGVVEERVSLLLSLQMKTVRTVSSGITQSVVTYSFGICRV